MRAIVGVAVLLVGIAWAASSFAQGTGRSLDIQPGARQNGMGETGVALESDPADALWWNPAALGFAEWQGVNYTRAKLLPGLADDIVYQHVAGGGRVRRGVGIGGSATFLSYGEPDWLDNGFVGEQSTEWSGAVAAGCEVLPGFALGVTAKYVKVNYLWLGDSNANTTGFDIGALYRHTFAPARVAVGFNAQNLGPKLKFGSYDEGYPLSRNLKLGAAATMPLATDVDGVDFGATVAFDFNHSWVTSEYEVENYGLELYAAHERWIRAAARVGYVSDDLGEITDATFGFGLRVAGASVDYAEVPQARNSGLPRVKKWTVGLHTDLLLELLAAH